ncbi:MAG: tRNA (N6-threonylcarbamoyladenosine(37)-N6)-methyltransferase TrmO [Chloroflexi bacterium]|nr:tRNA (N6-threonylcarbamoyladenosine(37)-N6)-methyltransferase TrmO [Chloroflexota bacterium]
MRDDGELILKPIGRVCNEVTGGKYGDWAEVVSRLELEPQYEEALRGLSDFSHVEVIFWINRAHAPDTPLIHPRDRQDLPLVGYFATRTPNRPNRLGLTVARLLALEGSVLVVQGLDAFDGTPVIDIKPFLPRPELSEIARIPDWLKQAREMKS